MFTFEPARLPESTRKLRQEVREFLKSEQPPGKAQVDAWLGAFSPDFSRKLGKQGYIGMTWPRRYGGHERSELERYVVLEELLAAAAPVSLHWVADRQMGPLILRYGTEEQKQRYLPKMAQGESYWAIGMSEPGAGSDLAAITAKLVPDGPGYRLSGQKIWTSGAHRSHYMMTLVRSGETSSDRHQGLTNVIVDLADPAVAIRPIRILNGEHHFNEVFFHDVSIPPESVLGVVGDGWTQVTEELAHERSRPERFLSTLPLLRSLSTYARSHDHVAFVREIMPLISELVTIRELSLAIAVILSQGGHPVVEAAVVKDMGTKLERKITEVAERILPQVPGCDQDDFTRLVTDSLLHGPGFTIRGGTNEILQGIIARGLGTR